jgi:hypothetical protein
MPIPEPNDGGETHLGTIGGQVSEHFHVGLREVHVLQNATGHNELARCRQSGRDIKTVEIGFDGR